MELKISAEPQAKLDCIAAQQGRDAESLVQEAVERLVDYDEWFLHEAEKGLAEIDQGNVLEDSQVGQRVAELIRRKQHRGGWSTGSSLETCRITRPGNDRHLSVRKKLPECPASGSKDLPNRVIAEGTFRTVEESEGKRAPANGS